jgi:hypothetical protein
VQVPALELADALLEARFSIREAIGDLEFLTETRTREETLSSEPRIATQTADRAIKHLLEAQESLDHLSGTIQDARRKKNQPEGINRAVHTVS